MCAFLFLFFVVYFRKPELFSVTKVISLFLSLWALRALSLL